MKNYQNKRTAHQRLVPSERCRLAEDTALKRDHHVRKVHINSNREDWKALARKAANEDEPSIRLTLLPIFEERGFQVQVVANVSEALATIKAQRFDVLLSDINIDRESDGFTVVQAM